ncbi:MAG: MaoC family dehydratase N-terminal domain-containing protein [Nocardioidaceae bacterium]|nr:MaoC family dehydratase N-terminal domain-containing protein [Nocardioidaceae bacterium]
MSDSAFHVDKVGEWSDSLDFHVDIEQSIAYARATNDPTPAHLDGTIAPPVFAVVPQMSIMADATLGVVPDELMMRILHGEHDFRFHRPIVPGETLVVRAKPVGIEGKASGTVVTTLLETRGKEKGDLVNEQYFVGFFRGGTFDGVVGQKSPEHSFDEALRQQEPDAVVETPFDEDQTFRYAEPAGDPMPIHLDDEIAKSMGLPGIIMHGLCTNAMLAHVLTNHAADGDSTRLKRLAVRFSKPGIPGDTMTTSIHRTGETTYSFESTNSAGDYLIRDGLAEFSA